MEKEPYPDTYFTFPVNSHQVKKQTDFSEKLKEDMEFRLRFFDLMANVNQQSRLIMENAAKEVILLSQ